MQKRSNENNYKANVLVEEHNTHQHHLVLGSPKAIHNSQELSDNDAHFSMPLHNLRFIIVN